MSAEIGHFALILALLTALAQAVLPMVGAVRGDAALMAFGRTAAQLQAVLIIAAFAALMICFGQADFSVALVANHSSLSMAPAMVLAQRCRFVDLDGPLLQSEDIADGFDYQNGVVAEPHQPRLWG